MIKKLFILFIFLLLQLSVFAATVEEENGITVIHKTAGVWTFKIDTKKFASLIKPVIDYATPNDIYARGGYTFVVNGGFFDMKNQNPVSYVVLDGKTVETPSDNTKMMALLTKEGRADAVLNRTEFRILEDNKGNISFDIAPHFDKPAKNKTIKHSIQGGPLILPYLEWEKEGFVYFNTKGRVEREFCDVTKRRPRTLLGLKGDDLYIIIFTDRAKVALNEAQDFCKKKLKLKKVMALDGGGSTAVNYKDIKLFSEGTDGRKVKSFLVIEEDVK